MGNWMIEFLQEFPCATERLTGTRQRHDLVEASVSDARQSRQVTTDTLRILENSENWNYPIWWPLLSKDFGKPVRFPQDLTGDLSRQRAIEILFDKLHHIEVVSVILRFIFPEDFGIISPPVGNLLNLPQLSDHVSYYVKYLQILRMLGTQYGLARIADVDMALWSAVHSQRELPGIAQSMNQDEYFQEVRLKNVFVGLGVLRTNQELRHTEKYRLKEHLLIARASITYDHILAALLCGRSYECLVDLMSRLWGIPKGTNRINESEMRRRLRMIGELQEFKALGFAIEDLNRWWSWRNQAVHPELGISHKDAAEFASQVSALCKKLLDSYQV